MVGPKARAAPKRKKHIKEKLTARQVAYLATQLAVSLGFHPFGVTQTARLLAAEEVTPLLFENNDYRLWLDLHYIAAEQMDDGKLIYVYVTRHHIAEELRDDNSARKRGGGFVDAPTKEQFAAARRKMAASASQSALRGTRADSGLCGADAALDLQAPWYAP